MREIIRFYVSKRLFDILFIYGGARLCDPGESGSSLISSALTIASKIILITITFAQFPDTLPLTLIPDIKWIQENGKFRIPMK